MKIKNTKNGPKAAFAGALCLVAVTAFLVQTFFFPGAPVYVRVLCPIATVVLFMMAACIQKAPEADAITVLQTAFIPVIAPTPHFIYEPITATPGPDDFIIPIQHPADALEFSASVWLMHGNNFTANYGTSVNLAVLDEGGYFTPVLKVTNRSGQTVPLKLSVEFDGRIRRKWKHCKMNNGISNSFYLTSFEPVSFGQHTVVYYIGKREVCRLTWMITDSRTAVDASTVSTGDYFFFGHYPHTSSGGDNTPIEWLVLDVKDGKALLISRYGLDAQPYYLFHIPYCDWEMCTLRSWLNCEFMDWAFTDDEEAAILLTDVDNSRRQCCSEWNTDSGSNTQERVFLLSCAEAHRYFGVEYYKVPGAADNMKSRISATAFALGQGACSLDEEEYKTAEGMESLHWWLRSPGPSPDCASLVYADGCLGSLQVDDPNVMIRPALWVDLSSPIFSLKT